VTGILAELVATAAFRPALPLEQLADLHIPFSELGFDAEPEAAVAEGVQQHSGLTLVVGHPGNGKSSLLAFVAGHLANAATTDDRLYLPLFVPVAARAEDAATLDRFGAIAAANLLATFDDLADEQRRAFLEATAETITREAPSNVLNAKFAAKVFGSGIEGGVESHDEVVTVTTAGGSVDEYGGLTTLAHTLRARNRELVLIVEDTDGWTLQDEHQGADLAHQFFGGVLSHLATAELSVVVALQTHWTRDVESFAHLNERAIKRVILPTFKDEDRAEATVRRIISGRLEWKLGGARNAADAVTDAAVQTLAGRLMATGSIRTVLTLLRDALDQAAGRLPERIDTEHLVEIA
jgi:energy-coupling factor transporter ATP-binding protein EcfA2